MSLLVIAYIIYHLVNSFGISLETVPAQLVTVNETMTVDAYILRSETVLSSSSAAGGVNCLYNDGAMVRRGAAVADVYTGTDTASVKSRIAAIDDQIQILQRSSVVESAAMTDSANINGELDDLYYTIQGKVNQNNIDYVFRRKNEMLILLNKRQIVQKLTENFAAQIADLQNQRIQLTASLTAVSETVSTPSSGYFYSDVDGYENSFSAAGVETMTPDSFRTLIETQPERYSTNVVGKVATDYKWYIACLVNSSQAAAYVSGNDYTVVFPYSSDAEVGMSLYRSVEDEASGQTLLIFSTGKINDGFNFLRRQSVDIVAQSYTGYRVPVSAVRIVDGRQGVYILNGNVVEFREITPMAEIDGNLIVSEQDKLNDESYASKLGFYDAIITKGKNLHENKVVG